jgi:hypothetical protein
VVLEPEVMVVVQEAQMLVVRPVVHMQLMLRLTPVVAVAVVVWVVLLVPQMAVLV